MWYRGNLRWSVRVRKTRFASPITSVEPILSRRNFLIEQEGELRKKISNSGSDGATAGVVKIEEDALSGKFAAQAVVANA